MAFFKFVLLLIIGVAVLFVVADLQGGRPPTNSALQSPSGSQQATYVSTNLSPKDSYSEVMLNFQYRFEDAYHAGLCGIRSQEYFTVFRVAQTKLSLQIAQQLGLSPEEIRMADAEVNTKFAKIHEGMPQFNIIEGCSYLRTSPRLVELDRLHQQIRRDQ
jgi:hypothetical protein